MLRTVTAALALSLAAGTAGAANLRVLSADCDPNLAVTVGLGVAGKICTASTSRNNAGRVNYGAPDGAFYPLGRSNGIVFDADPAFAGGPRNDESGQTPAVASRVSVNQPATPNPRANARSNSGGMSSALSGNSRAFGANRGSGGSPAAGRAPDGGDTVLQFSASDSDADSDSLNGTSAVIPIPLPAAGWLLLGALGALGVARRRARKA